MDDIRWKQRFQNFDRAYGTFSRTMGRYQANRDDEAIKMALVKSFEFTYELAWKTMKDFAEFEGLGEVQGSRAAIRFALQLGIIPDSETAEKWQLSVDQRNFVSHDYNQRVLDTAISFVEDTFFPLVSHLHEVLGAKCLA